ncbi:MAG: AsmA-like C-terminal region-containing protein, partial [Chromatiales bacterium]
GDFGRMRMSSRHTPKGHEITELATEGPLASFVATGIWRSRGGTSLDGILKSDQLGESLRKLAVTNQLTEAKGNIEVSLSWDEGLLDFSLPAATGVIHVSTDEGRIASADPGIGRILGLVNVSALKRRIQLDFSDFSQEGFVFDDMGGTLKLSDGVASTENLTIKAPAADIFISGEIDLGTRAVNQEIRVVPDLHGALPLAATAAGGPAAGAAALVIGKIAGKQIDRIAEIRYSVSGTWEDPVIERISQPNVTDDASEDLYDPLSDFQ